MNTAFHLIHEHSMTKFFTRVAYMSAFEEYENFCKPYFDELPSDPSELEALAEEGMKELVECWKSQRFFQRNSARCNDRIMFCTFFSPAARKHSEKAFLFSENLRGKWIAAYPNEPFETADFETINKGFDPTTLLGFKIK